MDFPKTDQNRLRRIPKRGAYDRQTIFEIIDQAWMCHIGFAGNGSATVIPMFHARVDDAVIIHGARSSRLMQVLGAGQPVCLSFVLLDGLVLAKSLFHHSMNYRSAVVFGRGHEVEDRTMKLEAFQALSDRMLPGRWEDARQPNDQELKATSVVAVKIESASAKIRTGGPVEEAEDRTRTTWSGVIPLKTVVDPPVPDAVLSANLPVPEYFAHLLPSAGATE